MHLSLNKKWCEINGKYHGVSYRSYDRLSFSNYPITKIIYICPNGTSSNWTLWVQNDIGLVLGLSYSYLSEISQQNNLYAEEVSFRYDGSGSLYTYSWGETLYDLWHGIVTAYWFVTHNKNVDYYKDGKCVNKEIKEICTDFYKLTIDDKMHVSLALSDVLWNHADVDYLNKLIK